MSTRGFVALVVLVAGGGCVSFDDFPEGNLCTNAVRDDEGRAIFYPESRICDVRLPGADAGEDGDGGTPHLPVRALDGGSR